MRREPKSRSGRPGQARCARAFVFGIQAASRDSWARRRTRPRAPHDQRTKRAYVFGAICPEEGKGAGLVTPYCDTRPNDAARTSSRRRCRTVAPWLAPSYVSRRKGYANPFSIFVNIGETCRAIVRHAARQGTLPAADQIDREPRRFATDFCDTAGPCKAVTRSLVAELRSLRNGWRIKRLSDALGCSARRSPFEQCPPRLIEAMGLIRAGAGRAIWCAAPAITPPVRPHARLPLPDARAAPAGAAP